VGAGRYLIRQKVTQSDLAAMTGESRARTSVAVINDWNSPPTVTRLAGYY
jgi:hypothetical protein